MHKKNNRRISRLRTCGSKVLAVSLLSLAPILSGAQPLETYLFTHTAFTTIDNVKNYSTEATKANECVMAGTLTYNHSVSPQCNYSLPHFLRFRNLADAVVSNLYKSNGYEEQRAVDIAVDPANTGISYVTVWMRPASTYVVTYPNSGGPCNYITPGGPLDRDVFKVMRIENGTGAIAQTISGTNDEVTVWDSDPLQAGQTFGNSLFPMHSIYKEYSGKKRLFVCGFRASQNTVMVGEGSFIHPEYENEKKAFVMAIDVDPISPDFMQVVESKYYDWRPSVPASNGKDFDVAMRMIPLANSDRILVTGSVNAMTNTTSALVRMATMNMVIEPDLSAAYDNSFVGQGKANGGGPNEYGIGAYQNGDDIFIVSNRSNAGVGGNPPIGMTILPEGINVTNLYGTTTLSYGTSRWEMDTQGEWALQTLDWNTVAYPPGYPSGTTNNYNATRFIIAGLGTSICCSNGGTNNVRPFLLDVDLQTADPFLTGRYFSTGAITTNLNYYMNLFGTSNDNTYYTAGGMRNIFFNPTFAARWTNTDVVQLNAPINDPLLTYPNVGLKAFHAVETIGGTIEAGCGNCNSCSVTPVARNVESNDITVTLRDPNIESNHEPSVTISEQIGGIGGCYLDPPVFKQGNTGVPVVKNTGKTTIAPNPATDEISVTLASDIAKDAKVQVVLHNMMGQVVGKLYEGSAAKLTTASKLHLPAVASGMYTVQVISNGKTVHQQKLAIQ